MIVSGNPVRSRVPLALLSESVVYPPRLWIRIQGCLRGIHPYLRDSLDSLRLRGRIWAGGDTVFVGIGDGLGDTRAVYNRNLPS